MYKRQVGSLRGQLTLGVAPLRQACVLPLAQNSITYNALYAHSGNKIIVGGAGLYVLCVARDRRRILLAFYVPVRALIVGRTDAIGVSSVFVYDSRFSSRDRYSGLSRWAFCLRKKQQQQQLPLCTEI